MLRQDQLTELYMCGRQDLEAPISKLCAERLREKIQAEPGNYSVHCWRSTHGISQDISIQDFLNCLHIEILPTN